MTPRIAHLVPGPEHHGVVRFGLELHTQLCRNGFAASLCRQASANAAHQAVSTARDGVHVQFTDRLYGATPEAAADTCTRIGAAVRAAGGHFTATLHDLPQPSDGAHFRRRTHAYERVAAICDAIVVNSDHERALLRDSRIEVTDVTVIPLPIDRWGGRPLPARSAGRPSVGVLGFLYPGKGHEEVLAAVAGLPPDVSVVAIGGPSDGHDDLVTELHAAAARQGRLFHVTGHVEDSDLAGVLRQVTVPVAAHRHISASGSLNTWLAVGRRPLAPANRYTMEIERRNPGCVALYRDTPAGLEAAVEAALADPESTWLKAGTIVKPGPDEAAAAYAEFFARCRT